MIYVLTMWNELEDCHEIIFNGPFETEEAAGTWGIAWGDANGNCPMWQVVDVKTTEVPVRAAE